VDHLRPLHLHRQLLHPGIPGFLEGLGEGRNLLDQHLVFLLDALEVGEGVVPVSGHCRRGETTYAMGWLKWGPN
jgi:hypothetical protein